MNENRFHWVSTVTKRTEYSRELIAFAEAKSHREANEDLFQRAGKATTKENKYLCQGDLRYYRGGSQWQVR